ELQWASEHAQVHQGEVSAQKNQLRQTIAAVVEVMKTPQEELSSFQKSLLGLIREVLPHL
ncbi:MAG TPA: hypothetical protein VMW65_00345, partial [Chloroflexota bacterium]|nr:hypothetical protein [Chloroflexota bacterium]